MRNNFDKQLTLLNSELTLMGSLCVEAIRGSVGYLTDDEEIRADEVYDTDRQIDQKERDIENLCMKLLMQQQPVARDLRTISSALKMISDMERIGDQASDIAEIAEYIRKSGMKSETHIADMAHATIKMVNESIESFVKKDISLAGEVIKHDDIVDELFVKVKKELIEAVGDKKNDAEGLVDLLMIAKYFERIGDHAENIAEWVIFSISGKHKLK